MTLKNIFCGRRNVPFNNTGIKLHDSYVVQSRYGVSSVLALDDGLLVLAVPVLKLGVELEGDDLQVPGVVVPGEIAVHTHNVYIGCLDVGRGEQRYVHRSVV